QPLPNASLVTRLLANETRFLKKMYDFGLPFALIMNQDGIFDSKSRFELFKNNNFELLIPKGRMRFFDETMEIKNNPNFQS
ncbi:hypothetical protein QP487_13390, partial [Streptococcus pasteurianus]|nr:hypothetical protein [Streptococcus pasteurianus]